MLDAFPVLNRDLARLENDCKNKLSERHAFAGNDSAGVDTVFSHSRELPESFSLSHGRKQGQMVPNTLKILRLTNSFVLKDKKKSGCFAVQPEQQPPRLSQFTSGFHSGLRTPASEQPRQEYVTH